MTIVNEEMRQVMFGNPAVSAPGGTISSKEKRERQAARLRSRLFAPFALAAMLRGTSKRKEAQRLLLVKN